MSINTFGELLLLVILSGKDKRFPHAMESMKQVRNTYLKREGTCFGTAIFTDFSCQAQLTLDIGMQFEG